MSEVKKYPEDFVVRTIKLLKELDPKAKELGLEVTFLLNCLLGMVVTVLENIEVIEKSEAFNDLFKIRLKDKSIEHIIPKKIKAVKADQLLESYRDQVNQFEFLKNYEKNQFCVNETEIRFMSQNEIRNSEFVWLLRKIRNGIAHQNIAPTSERKEWSGIRIWNYNYTGLKDFAIEFKVNQLKKFSIEVAERYLECLRHN